MSFQDCVVALANCINMARLEKIIIIIYQNTWLLDESKSFNSFFYLILHVYNLWNDFLIRKKIPNAGILFLAASMYYFNLNWLNFIFCYNHSPKVIDRQNKGLLKSKHLQDLQAAETSPDNARQIMQNWHCSEINLLRSLSALAVPDNLCVDLRNFPHILKLSTVSEHMKSSVCTT